MSSLFYSAYKFAPPLFSFYMLKTTVEEEAKLGHMYTDESLRKRITEKAAAWDVPLNYENFKIERSSEEIFIDVNYTVTLNFFDRYSKDLDFKIEARESLKDKSRVLQ